MSGDDFKPVSPADVTDLAALPRLVGILTEEVRNGFDGLRSLIRRGLERVDARLDDHGTQLSDLKAQTAKHAEDLQELKDKVRELDRARRINKSGKKR